MRDHRSEGRANGDMLDSIPPKPDDRWLNQGRGHYLPPGAPWKDWAVLIVVVAIICWLVYR